MKPASHRMKQASSKSATMTAWATLLVAIAEVHHISASLPPIKGNQSAVASCYADQPDKYFLFSTKTSGFEIVERNTAPVSVQGWSHSHSSFCQSIWIDFLGCQPKSFWMIVRHGTRNPSDDDIREIANGGSNLAREIVANHKAGRCQIHVYE